MGKMPVEGLPQYQFSFLTQSREPFTPCLGRDGRSESQTVTRGSQYLLQVQSKYVILGEQALKQGAPTVAG